MSEFWLGHVALGRPTTRNRAEEFTRTATVAELHALAERTLAQALADIRSLDAGDGSDEAGREPVYDGDVSDGAMVLHVLEELFQHVGHMEITADALLQP